MTKTTMMMVALLTVISVTGWAQDNANAELKIIPGANRDTYRMVYVTDERETVRVELSNEQGQVLYSQSIKTDGFIRPFNFEKLGSGTYTFAVQNDGTSVEETVTYLSQIDAIKAGLSFDVTDARKLTLAAEGLVELPLNVRIYDAKRKLVFDEEMVAKENLYNRVYDLKQVNSESVTVVVFHGDQEVARQKVKF